MGSGVGNSSSSPIMKVSEVVVSFWSSGGVEVKVDDEDEVEVSSGLVSVSPE